MKFEHKNPETGATTTVRGCSSSVGGDGGSSSGEAAASGEEAAGAVKLLPLVDGCETGRRFDVQGTLCHCLTDQCNAATTTTTPCIMTTPYNWIILLMIHATGAAAVIG